MRAVGLGAVLGAAFGIAGYTFIYAKGASYLTNDPSACANCHIMQDHFDAWIKSSHRAVAVCNDCHAPHDFFGKYMTKADNGFWHSFAFTTGIFHEPIQIKGRNQRVTEQACLRCHQEIVEEIVPLPHTAASGISCIRCHQDVGHPKY